MSFKEESRELRLTATRICRWRHLHGPAVWHNLCQKGTRTALGAGPGAPSAKAAWLGLEGTGDRRRYNPEHPPPFGVPVYFSMNTPYWHATISAGKGFVWTTDAVRNGRYDKVSIGWLERRWHCKCVGWTTSINGKRVW